MAQINATGFLFNGRFPVYDAADVRGSLMRLGAYVPPELDRANTILLRRGVDPGEAWVLLNFATVNALPATFTNSVTAFYGDDSVTYSKLRLAASMALDANADSPENCVVLAKFVDERALLPYLYVNRGFNRQVRHSGGANYAGSLQDPNNPGSEWDWKTLIEHLWSYTTGTGVFGNLIGPVPTGGYNPRNYGFFGITVRDALQRVLQDCNHVLLRSLDGVYQAVENNPLLGTYAQVFSSAVPHLIHPTWDYNYRILPEKVAVVFPATRKDFQNDDDEKILTGQERQWTDPVWIKEVTTTAVAPGTAGIAVGTKAVVYDSEICRLPPSGSDTPTNLATINAIADIRALEYIKAMSINTTHHAPVHSVLLPVVPSQSIRAVAWYDRGAGVRTQTVFDDRPLSPEKIGERSGLTRENLGAMEFPSAPDINRQQVHGERILVGVIASTIAPNSSVEMAVAAGFPWAPSQKTVQVYNPSNNCSIPGPDRVVAVWHEQSQVFVALGVCGGVEGSGSEGSESGSSGGSDSGGSESGSGSGGFAAIDLLQCPTREGDTIVFQKIRVFLEANKLGEENIGECSVDVCGCGSGSDSSGTGGGSGPTTCAELHTNGVIYGEILSATGDAVNLPTTFSAPWDGADFRADFSSNQPCSSNPAFCYLIVNCAGENGIGDISISGGASWLMLQSIVSLSWNPFTLVVDYDLGSPGTSGCSGTFRVRWTG